MNLAELRDEINNMLDSPLTPEQFPLCGQCHRQVERIEQRFIPETREMQYAVSCHGEVEIITVPRGVLLDTDPKDWDFSGVAFSTPRLIPEGL